MIRQKHCIVLCGLALVGIVQVGAGEWETELECGGYYKEVESNRLNLAKTMIAILETRTAAVSPLLDAKEQALIKRKGEAIRILGLVRAVEAIPSLIANIEFLLKYECTDLSFEGTHPCALALIRIGNVGTPEILSELSKDIPARKSLLLVYVLVQIEGQRYAVEKLADRTDTITEETGRARLLKAIENASSFQQNATHGSRVETRMRQRSETVAATEREKWDELFAATQLKQLEEAIELSASQKLKLTEMLKRHARKYREASSAHARAGGMAQDKSLMCDLLERHRREVQNVLNEQQRTKVRSIWLEEGIGRSEVRLVSLTEEQRGRIGTLCREYAQRDEIEFYPYGNRWYRELFEKISREVLTEEQRSDLRSASVVEHATVELKVCGLSESQTNHIRRISSEEIERKGLKDQTIAYLPQGVPTEVLKRIVEEVLTEEQKQVAKKNVVRLKP